MVTGPQRRREKMSRKKLQVRDEPIDMNTLGDIADLVWTLSQSSSTPEAKEAAAGKLKSMGGYFATPINVTINKKGE